VVAIATVAIAARNASLTIERAIRSALLQENFPILMVDDFSSDDTAARAEKIGGGRLKIIRPTHHRSLGLTRQTALDAIATPFGVWLDADDELLPGRVERLVHTLVQENADLASDAMELFDGSAGTFLRYLTIPGFFKMHHPLARLFERNYLPGLGCLAFRTDFARKINYDATLDGAEDVDFALRSVAAGARFCLVDELGYRQYAYCSSVSRQRENQLEMYRRVLLKHDYESVRRLLEQAGHSPRVCFWALVSMALFRRDFEKAMEFVFLAESMLTDPTEILEPLGPCPMPEAWRVAFFRGSALLMQQSWKDAEFWLRHAETIQPVAESANNLGIAIAKQRGPDYARAFFTCALDRFPNYADAAANRDSKDPSRITFHPLRREPTRRDF
jgi:glycosyltransferase involved in cell wall biosynthesis